jgi:folate-binding protein YgfZ
MNTQISHGGMVPLTHWGLIRARGADTVKFLQGQLTNDVASMGQSEARLAGFCSAKGRLQASFVVWKLSPDEVLLACAASVLAPTLKRLSMFVLRAQCKLTDASAELALYGALDNSARSLMGDATVWSKRDVQAGTLVRLPDVHQRPRCMMALAPVDAQPTQASLDSWRLLEVQSGIATIEAATVEQFVPQMLNYELVGGVDFQKGCYPGQEVVARSQYRGTIKRRTFLFECEAMASAGQEVFHGTQAEQPAGMVVNAAPLPDGVKWAALVELKLASLDGQPLRVGTTDGARLTLGALPYSVPTEAAPAA